MKEIFDKTNELQRDPGCMIFNSSRRWATPSGTTTSPANALADVFEAVKRPGDRFSGACFTSGSAGTLSTGDRLKELYPG